MTLTVSQNLPPVPSAMKIAQQDMITQPWQQWFVNLTAKVNQINAVLVAISGAGTTLAAFDTLSPLTTKGDLLTYNSGNNIRLGIGTTGQVLTVVSGLPAWATAPSGGGITYNAQTGTTYTFVLGDAGNEVSGNNASAITFTVPPNSSVAFPIGTLIIVSQLGAGAITIAAGAGVTIVGASGAATTAQYDARVIEQISANTWRVW